MPDPLVPAKGLAFLWPDPSRPPAVDRSVRMVVTSVRSGVVYGIPRVRHGSRRPGRAVAFYPREWATMLRDEPLDA